MPKTARRQRERAAGELDVDGRPPDRRPRSQIATKPGLDDALRRSPSGDARPGQRRQQHRRRHRQQLEAGLERVEPEDHLEVDGQHEERPEQDELLHRKGGQTGDAAS